MKDWRNGEDAEPDGCGFPGLADRLLGRGEDDVVVACAWFSGDFFQAAAGGLGQDEGEQRAEDGYAGGEQQRAAQAEGALAGRGTGTRR